MVNLETLTARSLRRYELGRLRMAGHVGIVLMPLIAACLLDPVGREASGCCAALLVVGSFWLRFRNRAGVESVSAGLLAGVVPLTSLLLLKQLDPSCATARAWSYCSGISLLAGAAAGAVVALRERARVPLSGNWPLTLGIALLTASLGCIKLGVASLAGVALGMVFGRASMRAASSPTPG